MRKILPPTYLLLAIVFMATLHFVFPMATWIALPWSLLGLAPLLVGIILNLIADKELKKLETTVKPFEPSSALATDGVYRLSRHPMYLGMVLILAGIAFVMGSLTPWLVVPFFALLLDRVFIEFEESMMEQAFGDAYRDYRRRVRRWI